MPEYKYWCEYCLDNFGPYARWSQEYLDHYHGGELERLDESHRKLWYNAAGHKVELIRRDKDA